MGQATDSQRALHFAASVGVCTAPSTCRISSTRKFTPDRIRSRHSSGSWISVVVIVIVDGETSGSGMRTLDVLTYATASDGVSHRVPGVCAYLA